MKKKIYVHVADDHKILIDGMMAILNTDDDIELKGYSLTGKEVIKWFSNKRNKADVLLLDITMPVVDGLEVLQYFQDNNIKQKTIVLSSYDDIKIVSEVLRRGARGYITKGEAGDVIEAIKEVAKGGQFFSDNIQKDLLKTFSGYDIEEGEKPEKIKIESLTERELETLKLITQEYSTTEIADKLNVGIRTVDTYRKNLLTKLKVKNSVGLAMYAVKNNII